MSDEEHMLMAEPNFDWGMAITRAIMCLGYTLLGSLLLGGY